MNQEAGRSQNETTQQKKGSRRLRGPAGALSAAVLAAAFTLPLAAPASAADLEEGSFSGEARNYTVFAGIGLVNNLANVSANIGESVTVANSEGLADYAGTGVGEYGVPAAVANDPEARAYSRSSPVGVGAVGIPIDIVNAESVSTTIQDVDSDTNDFGNIEIPLLGNLSALTGATSTTWTDDVLTNGGVVADAENNIGDVSLITGLESVLPLPVPGLSDIFPVASANLGQNTNEVSLVPTGSETCAGGLGVQTEATWTWADVSLLGDNIQVSWGGEFDGTPGTITATATGEPNGASLDVSSMPNMAVAVGDAEIVIEPGLGIELDELLGGTGAEFLLNVIDGELVYGGITNVEEAADGTHAAGTMGGLQGDLQLLSVPVLAPNGLGSLELGFQRADVAATISEGGLNCEDEDGGDPDGDQDGDQDGAVDGTPDGTDEGDVDGTPDGTDEGDVDGTDDGDVEGAVDGTPDGTVDGDPEGAVDGDPEGAVDGTDEGTVDGDDDGAVDGTPDGAVEGDVDGTDDGDVEGAVDGTEDGTPEGDVDGTDDGAVDGDQDGIPGDVTAEIEHETIQRLAEQTGHGHGFEPGEEVRATMNSAPTLELGTAIADDEGTVSFTWEIPAEAELGEHTFTVTSVEDEEREDSVTFTVIAEDGGAEDGTEDGAEDGTEDGAEDGTEDGAEDGDVDGTEDGDVEGDVDGTPDGTVEGDVDGTEDGDVEGSADGTEDGDVEGAVDGTPDGTVDGDDDGATDGSADGAEAGAEDGSAEGDADAAADGSGGGAAGGVDTGAEDGSGKKPSDGLASTGFNATTLALLAPLALLVGAGLLVVMKRRQSPTAE